jgi:protein phosphatase
MIAPNSDDTSEFLIGRRAKTKGDSSADRVDVSGLSDAGLVRERNEDHFMIARFGRFLDTLGTNLPEDKSPGQLRESGYAMVVADGMGGHAAGEEASKLAIANLVEVALSTPDWILRLDDPDFIEEVMRRAAERFGQVDQMMSEQANEDPNLKGFGTTMTYAASLRRDLFVVHIGDSRVYLFRRGTLHQLTRDHTLAQGLADSGRITQEEVATHHLRHVLTRSLGRDKKKQPDVHRSTLEHGDVLLLCTDGLTDMVDDAGIAEILAADLAAQQICESLVKKALQAGGKDNVTAVVARYTLPTQPG